MVDERKREGCDVEEKCIKEIECGRIKVEK